MYLMRGEISSSENSDESPEFLIPGNNEIHWK
jgi:hypothetical protein